MTNTSTSEQHPVVSPHEWVAARQQLLAEEKQLTRARDALNVKRRALPWQRVEKEYVFDTPDGPKNLRDLFAGRSQLIIYHFMWRHELGEGCVGCSFLSDHIDGANLHLSQHDVSFVVISRAPLALLENFKNRMGWHFRWVSSAGSDFNLDYHVSFTLEQLASGTVYYNYGPTAASIDEASGLSVFYQNEAGDVFHTYSSYGRGNEEILGAYMYLDITPKGRNETEGGNLTNWVRHHDRYEAGGFVDKTGGYIAPNSTAEKTCCGGEKALS